MFSVVNLFTLLDFDHIYLETIGVEQNNMDFTQIASVVVSVLVPDEQDWVQILKTDNLDMANLIFINKSDLMVQSDFSSKSKTTLKSNEYLGYKNKIIEGSARNNMQIVELYNLIAEELRNEIKHES
jgi:putative protein kinase ArgK-like GTPase of G3E family